MGTSRPTPTSCGIRNMQLVQDDCQFQNATLYEVSRNFMNILLVVKVTIHVDAKWLYKSPSIMLPWSLEWLIWF